MEKMNILPEQAVFVSDFDGTLAHPDFYQLIRQQLVPDDTPDYWQAYRAGKMTHFDALKAYFAAAEGDESALRGITERMQLPADLASQLERLRASGWEVIIVSAGCSWYIDRLLDRAGVQLPVYANPGHVREGRLIMERPATSSFSCQDNGIDKAGIVRSLLQEGRQVAFAGDGYPDLSAARIVAPKRRFARSDLARACREEKLPFQPFERWPDVVDALVQDPPCEGWREE